MKKILFAFILSALVLCLFSCGNTGGGVVAPLEQSSADAGLTHPGETMSAEPDIQKNPDEIRISFAAAGDNIVHQSVIDDAKLRAAGGKTYNFLPMYEGIADLIAKADISFVNQEAPLAGASLGYAGYPNFNSPAEVAEALIDTGFDIINIANNHMLDKGSDGYENTIEFLKTLPVTFIGGYTKSSYDELCIYEEQGVKIALLSYTTLINEAHKNDIPKSSDLIIPYADEDDITRQVTAAKKSADVVVVSMHWGTEDSFETSANQRKYAQLCADLGVDVIIGHHPHVLENVEWLSRADGHKTLVIYSLGNLLSTMLYSRNMVGGIATFDIVKDKSGNIKIENPILTPVVCHYDADPDRLDSSGLATRTNVNVYLMENYSEAMADKNGTQLNGKFNLSDLKKYVTDTVSSEFLPAFLK